MDYHGNHYFTDVKISNFVAGRPDVSYIIELECVSRRCLGQNSVINIS